VLDRHSDVDHNRSVFTLCAATSTERATALPDEISGTILRIAEMTVAEVDLRNHTGAHPRIGALDVVPFVSLRLDEDQMICDGPIEEAVVARDAFMDWAAGTLDLPCFAYGPERSLPEVRRAAFRDLAPERGPGKPHLTAGACAVGARPLLLAYNLWLASSDLDLARTIARGLRGPAVRSLGLAVGDRVQVSNNLIDPFRTGPAEIYDRVARLAEQSGNAVEKAELVGLAPMRVVRTVPAHRRVEVGLDEDRTIEARLESGPF
jgi:glutamate formiminotransferase / 5-formyltetrahydrofolate cyclo-ligase